MKQEFKLSRAQMGDCAAAIVNVKRKTPSSAFVASYWTSSSLRKWSASSSFVNVDYATGACGINSQQPGSDSITSAPGASARWAIARWESSANTVGSRFRRRAEMPGGALNPPPYRGHTGNLRRGRKPPAVSSMSSAHSSKGCRGVFSSASRSGMKNFPARSIPMSCDLTA